MPRRKSSETTGDKRPEAMREVASTAPVEQPLGWYEASVAQAGFDPLAKA